MITARARLLRPPDPRHGRRADATDRAPSLRTVPLEDHYAAAVAFFTARTTVGGGTHKRACLPSLVRVQSREAAQHSAPAATNPTSSTVHAGPRLRCTGVKPNAAAS